MSANKKQEISQVLVAISRETVRTNTQNPMLNDNWCKLLPELIERLLGQLVPSY
jgi:hypothetical protein